MSTVVEYDLPHALEELLHLLPVQGPIEVFIHHNTLHSFEKLDFEDAVEQAGLIYGARPYLHEEEYRDLFLEGTIREKDIEKEVGAFLTDNRSIVPHYLTRNELRRALIYNGLTEEDEIVSRWKQSEARLRLRPDLSERTKRSLIEETRQWIIGLHGAGLEDLVTELRLLDRESPEIARRDLKAFIRAENETAQSRKRGDTLTASLLWAFSSKSVQNLDIPEPPLAIHHQQALKSLTGIDIFDLVNQLLIQLCSTFVDQGVSYWPMPGRDAGFLSATEELLLRRGIPSAPWVERAESLFRELRPSSLGARATLHTVLKRLGVSPEGLPHYLIHGGLSLKGWAGFIALLERKPQIARDRPLKASFEEFIAVQNLLILAAVSEVTEAEGIDTCSLPVLARYARRLSHRDHVLNGRRQITQILFETCQITGLGPQFLAEHGSELAAKILDEVNEFPETTRRRIWHLAYERSFLDSVLGAFRNHHPRKDDPAEVPIAQVMFCIDEREESIRRHLEEINPKIETLGYPGFFSLPLAYQGMHHLHAEALCPVVLEPTIAVSEYDGSVDRSKKGNIFQRFMGYLSREIKNLTHTPLGGSLLSTTVGHFALFPFFLRILRPALAGRVHSVLHDTEIENPSFEVRPARSDVSMEDLRKTIVDGLRTVLHTTGIAHTKSKLIVIMGHGSSSLNNPHESAHDCGACGGRRGSPSARLFSRFANEPEIRAELRKAGVELQPDTYVLGVYHDTCDDSITVFDEHLVPETHRALVETVARDCRAASARNALERSRRFLTTPGNLSPQDAAESMLHRAEDFSEPRPEYGHATNALAFIGRRARCRGLFLDRRAFLSSYDAAQDPDLSALKGLLAAVVPVCAGINLEYYFSLVDSTNYGCGTKLPHNIVGQIGVMDGTASDLRTGLPWQMVEIHEPVRLVMVVEALPENLLKILEQLSNVRNLIEKRWLWLVAVHPEKEQYWLYSSGNFKEYSVAEHPLPMISDSLSYCSHTTQPLPFASVASLTEKSKQRGAAYEN